MISNFKPLLGALLLLATFFPMQSQSLPKELVFQRGEREKTVQIGEYLSYKINGSRRTYHGILEGIHAGQLTIDRHQIPLGEIRRIHAIPPKSRKWGLGLALTGLSAFVLLSSWLGRRVVWAIAFGGQQYNQIGLKRYFDIQNFSVMTAFNLMIIGNFIFLVKGRSFRLNRWKVSLREVRE